MHPRWVLERFSRPDSPAAHLKPDKNPAPLGREEPGGFLFPGQGIGALADILPLRRFESPTQQIANLGQNLSRRAKGFMSAKRREAVRRVCNRLSSIRQGRESVPKQWWSVEYGKLTQVGCGTNT